MELHPRGFEYSNESNRSDILIRRKLMDLLAQHGQSEVFRIRLSL